MRTELILANTFMDVAETTKLSDHRSKSRKDTQKAYRELLHFVPRLQLSSEQKLEFNQQTEKLRERMVQAVVEL